MSMIKTRRSPRSSKSRRSIMSLRCTASNRSPCKSKTWPVKFNLGMSQIKPLINSGARNSPRTSSSGSLRSPSMRRLATRWRWARRMSKTTQLNRRSTIHCFQSSKSAVSMTSTNLKKKQPSRLRMRRFAHSRSVFWLVPQSSSAVSTQNRKR